MWKFRRKTLRTRNPVRREVRRLMAKAEAADATPLQAGLSIPGADSTGAVPNFTWSSVSNKGQGSCGVEQVDVLEIECQEGGTAR
jgi:hypothetical protein